MRRLILLFTVCLLSSTLFVVEVFADSEEACTYRPPNKSEKTFFSQFAVLRSAVPPVPEGWALRDDEVMKPSFTGIPEQVCDERLDHELELSLIYERKPDQEKENATLNRAKNAAPDKAGMAGIKQLQAKQTELVKQASDAAGRGEMDKADKLYAELDVLAQKIQKMFDDLYAPQTKITAELDWDRSAIINIVVNGSGGDCNGNPQPIDIPGAVAYRCAYNDGYTPDGEVLDHAFARVLIVLGHGSVRMQDWKRLGRDHNEFTDRMLTIEALYDRAQPLVVQNVVISIDSDNPERVDGLFRGLRLDVLKSLINKK